MSLSSKSNSQTSPQKKIKWYTQVFNVKWLTDTQLKDWLQQDRNNKDYSYCKCCKITLKNPCYFVTNICKESFKKLQRIFDYN